MGEQQEFKPNLMALGDFDGKIKADYNEFTQYLTLVLAKEGRMSQFNGIVKNQDDVNHVVANLKRAVLLQTDDIEEAEVVEEKPKKPKK